MLREDGKVIWNLRKPWRDGTRSFVFDPLVFIERLVALIPHPREHQLTYHALRAGNAAELWHRRHLCAITSCRYHRRVVFARRARRVFTQISPSREDIFLGPSSCFGFWITASTAVSVPDASDSLIVTHPFHPRAGETLRVLSVRRAWYEARVDCCDRDGVVFTLAVGWTSLATPDPIVATNAGRAPFRVEDLLGVVKIVAAESVRPSVEKHREGVADV